MCIIAYAPKGKQIKEDTIRYMFEGNPDGAGIMWKPQDNALVEIRKGFMDVDALLEEYRKIPVDCEKAIHCRIATAGKVSTACCHPFPVRAKIKSLKKGKDTTSIAMMHNGTISYCNPKGGMQSNHSDTMEFVHSIVYPLRNNLDSKAIQTLITNSTLSRFLFFRQDGDPILIGHWIEKDGIFYSNDNYKPFALSEYSNGFYNNGRYCYYNSFHKCYGYYDRELMKFMPLTTGSKTSEDDCATYDHYAADEDYIPETFYHYELKATYYPPFWYSDEFLGRKMKYTAEEKADEIWVYLENEGNEVVDVAYEIKEDDSCISFGVEFYSTRPDYQPMFIKGTIVDYCTQILQLVEEEEE